MKENLSLLSFLYIFFLIIIKSLIFNYILQMAVVALVTYVTKNIIYIMESSHAAGQLVQELST